MAVGIGVCDGVGDGTGVACDVGVAATVDISVGDGAGVAEGRGVGVGGASDSQDIRTATRIGARIRIRRGVSRVISWNIAPTPSPFSGGFALRSITGRTPRIPSEVRRRGANATYLAHDSA